MRLANEWRLVALTPPDPAVLRAFAGSILPVALEIMGLSILLAWAVGRSVSRPVRELEIRARRFGEDPLSHGAVLPATDDEIRASSLQFVRKLSGFTRPSQANQLAFARAVDQVAQAAHELLGALVTNAPPRDRAVEASKARAKAADRFPSRREAS